MSEVRGITFKKVNYEENYDNGKGIWSFKASFTHNYDGLNEKGEMDFCLDEVNNLFVEYTGNKEVEKTITRKEIDKIGEDILRGHEIGEVLRQIERIEQAKKEEYEIENVIHLGIDDNAHIHVEIELKNMNKFWENNLFICAPYQRKALVLEMEYNPTTESYESVKNGLHYYIYEYCDLPLEEKRMKYRPCKGIKPVRNFAQVLANKTAKHPSFKQSAL